MAKKQVAEVTLKKIILKFKQYFIIVGFFSLFINLLMLVPSLYMLQLYDRVVTGRSEGTLIMLTLIVVVLLATIGFLEAIRTQILIKIGNGLDNYLGKKVFTLLFELERAKPGQSSSALLNDLSQLKMFITGNGIFAFFDLPWIPIYMGVLFMFHPYFGIFAIFAAIVLLIITVINEFSTKEKLQEASQLLRASNLYVDQSVKNAEVVIAMGMQNNIKKKWVDKYYKALIAQNDASFSSSIFSNLSKSLRMLFQSLILGIGAYLVINSEVTAGMMIAGSIVMGKALGPIDLMINSWKGFSTARIAYKKLDDLIIDFPDNKEYMRLPEPKGEIILNKVVITAPNANEPSVKNVSLKIDIGDVVGIIGHSGAGKSSLLRAILGVWPITGGEIRLDKADIFMWNKNDLGKYMGYLPQDVELFSGTVAENIARFGEVDAQKVIDASMKADIHEMILRLPEGYDTKIGSGGVILSGGQKQRIGLARALYDNPVLIILDEPNSNLDESGENALLNAIVALKKEQTTILLVTHKPSTLQVTNKLIVMRNGVVEQYGNTIDIFRNANNQDNTQRPAQNQQQTQQPTQPKPQPENNQKPSFVMTVSKAEGN